MSKSKQHLKANIQFAQHKAHKHGFSLKAKYPTKSEFMLVFSNGINAFNLLISCKEHAQHGIARDISKSFGVILNG